MRLDELAGQVRAALGSGDLTAYGHLLAPDVRWGPPGDQVSGCHNRRQVLEWYQAARDQGMRAEVTEVVSGTDRLLVGLVVSGRRAEDGDDEDGDDEVGGDGPRWQVLTVRDGLIADIRGFDDRAEAAAEAGVTSPS